MKQNFIILLAAILFGCSSSHKLTGTDYADFSAGDMASPGSVYPEEVAEDLGWMDLASADYGEVTEEFRITLISESGPFHLFRFKNGRSVEGEAVLFWEKNPVVNLTQPHKNVPRYLKGRCTEFFETENYEYCKPVYTHEPNWGTVFGNLEANNIWQLPGQNELAQDSLPTENIWQLDIQVRLGNYYRSYFHTSPDKYENSEDKLNLLAISTQLQTLQSAFQNQDNFDSYTGLTSGVRNSAFTLCDSSEVWRFGADLDQLIEKNRYPIRIAQQDSLTLFVELKGYVTDTWYSLREGTGYRRTIRPVELNELMVVTNGKCRNS